MSVVIVARVKHPEIEAARIRSDARTLLGALEQRRADLTIVLTDDASIHALNRDFRHQDRPTDVLAFAMHEGLRAPGDEGTLGDVVISLDTAARQARRRRRPLDAEVRTLLIHGILHLLGYDHERSAPEAARMRAKERELAGVLAAAPRQPRAKRTAARGAR